MITRSEKLILEAFLSLKDVKLLNHEFEYENDYLAGYVSRFLNGERFDFEFSAFSKEEKIKINNLITMNINSLEGKELLTYYLLVKLVCNILNKYKT